MKDIANIIFDLGGVVIDLDRDRAVRALDSLGIKDASKLLGEYEQKGPFLQLETGEITAAQLYDLLLPLCKEGTTSTHLQDAFEEFLVAIPRERLETIRRLREAGYKTFVLSNTNPIMYNHWIDRAFRQEGLTINDYFDGIVTSFQERTCKPDPEIFRTVLRRYGLKGENTLMLDDSEANCNGARNTGMQAICVRKSGEESFSGICKRLAEAKK